MPFTKSGRMETRPGSGLPCNGFNHIPRIMKQPAVTLALGACALASITGMLWAQTPVDGLEYASINGAVTITEITDDTMVELVIPESIEGWPVTTLGDHAFADSSLVRITIPASVVVIGDYTFESCWDLTDILVDDNNPVFADIDGVLFDKALFTLIRFPEARTGEYAIPDGTRTIGDGAFVDCWLSGIQFPNTLTAIGDGAFYDCTSLTSLIIPDSVIEIGAGSFANCISLTALFFLGDPPIAEGSPFDSFFQVDRTVYYVVGTPGWGEAFAGIPTRPFHPRLWHRASEQDNGWLWLDVFGWCAKLTAQWIYRPGHGFLDAVNDYNGTVYFYDPALGAWFWTTDTTYPNAYRYGMKAGWVRL